MSTTYQIIVCAGIVPDTLQRLEPVVVPENSERVSVAFRACTGELHSAEN